MRLVPLGLVLLLAAHASPLGPASPRSLPPSASDTIATTNTEEPATLFTEAHAVDASLPPPSLSFNWTLSASDAILQYSPSEAWAPSTDTSAATTLHESTLHSPGVNTRARAWSTKVPGARVHLAFYGSAITFYSIANGTVDLVIDGNSTTPSPGSQVLAADIEWGYHTAELVLLTGALTLDCVEITTGMTSQSPSLEAATTRTEPLVWRNVTNTFYDLEGDWDVNTSLALDSSAVLHGHPGAALSLAVPANTSFLVINGRGVEAGAGYNVTLSPAPPALPATQAFNAVSSASVDVTYFLAWLDPQVTYNVTLAVDNASGTVALGATTFYSALWPHNASAATLPDTVVLATVTGGTSAGTIAGCVVGGILGAVVVGWVIWFMKRRQQEHARHKHASQAAELTNNPNIRGATPYFTLAERTVSETPTYASKGSSLGLFMTKNNSTNSVIELPAFGNASTLMVEPGHDLALPKLRDRRLADTAVAGTVSTVSGPTGPVSPPKPSPPRLGLAGRLAARRGSKDIYPATLGRGQVDPAPIPEAPTTTTDHPRDMPKDMPMPYPAKLLRKQLVLDPTPQATPDATPSTSPTLAPAALPDRDTSVPTTTAPPTYDTKWFEEMQGSPPSCPPTWPPEDDGPLPPPPLTRRHA